MDFTILVDTRERQPLVFADGTPAAPATLPTGDYSVRSASRDYRLLVAVERKSLPDLYGCIGQDRARFERELARLALYPYPAIVVEATLADIAAGVRYSRIHPHSAIGSLTAWSTRHRIPVWLAGDANAAAVVVEKLLRHAVKALEAVEVSAVEPARAVTSGSI